MEKFSAYPKIGQYRQVITEVKLRNSYVGKDDNGDPIYDKNIQPPKIKFTGSVKLHGTNAGVGYSVNDGLWVQSRSNIITPENDNFGFARYVEDNKTAFIELFEHILYVNPNLKDENIYIFGEWAGKGIQKSVGISQIEKSFFIFALKIQPKNKSEAYYLPSNYLRDNEHRIYNIEDFLTYELEIDFARPDLVQNKLGEITLSIEKSCPVAKAFGFEGIGEGCVWVANVDGHTYRFKVKGEKHSVSKVKTLAAVDTEKMNSIHDFIEYSVTENRFMQAMNIVFPDGVIDIKKLGEVIRWVVGDVTIEEADVLKESNLEPKDVNKYISNKVRILFFEAYNQVT